MKNWSSRARRIETVSELLPYSYPVANGNPGSAANGAPADLWPGAGAAAVTEKTREAEARERERQAWQAGYAEAERSLREGFESRQAQERQALLASIQDFAHNRDAYFHRVEGEVVRLALAIARKIIHREAQIDPLLLTGVARVALERVAAGTRVRLRVPPDQAHLWRAHLVQFNDARTTVELVGDNELEAGRCVLETEMGAVELTCESQLTEIEQGLFDLLANGKRA